MNIWKRDDDGNLFKFRDDYIKIYMKDLFKDFNNSKIYCRKSFCNFNHSFLSGESLIKFDNLNSFKFSR